MLDAITTAAGGIRSAVSQFEKSAQNVVKATSSGADEDLSTAIVDGKQSSLALKANVAVVKTADKMLGSLLDTLA